MEKLCLKCLELLPITQFYKCRSMSDGLYSACIKCYKKAVKLREQTKEGRERQRARDQDPRRIAYKLEAQRRHRENYQDRSKARNAVNNAVRDGRLIRQPCEVCGGKAQAHHDDYSQPLKVRWLCFKHHREDEHGQITNA